MERLTIKDEFPEGMLDADAAELVHYLQGPTLFRFSGTKSPALFVSILLHGNEDVGWKAIQKLFQKYRERVLPRELLLLVGNPQAAAQGVRKLPTQEDFNRVWPGTDHSPSPLSACMEEVVEHCRHQGLFVSIDLHNNTGTNPLYGCINDLEPQTIQLASLFARTMIYFQRPLGVQSAAMSHLCPSLTCECGKVGDPQGVERAFEVVDACLHLSELPNHLPPATDYHLLHTTATIKVPIKTRIAWDKTEDSDLWLPRDLDHRNFQPQSFGSRWGEVRPGLSVHDAFHITDEQDQCVTDSYFAVVDGNIQLLCNTIPAMFTQNLQIIRDDCLGYFMEEIRLDR